MTITIAEAVQNGADLLDREKPDWVDSIDLETLDLVDCRLCVLGQVYGDYDQGCWILFEGDRSVLYYDQPKNSVTHGFSIPQGYNNSDAWNELQETWVGLIEERVNSQ